MVGKQKSGVKLVTEIPNLIYTLPFVCFNFITV